MRHPCRVRGLPPVGVGAILPSSPVRAGLHPGSQPEGSGTDRSRGCRASWEGTGRAGRAPAAVSEGCSAAPMGARLHCSRNGCSARRLPAVDSSIDSRGIGYCNCGALGPRRLSPAAPAFPAGRNPADPVSAGNYIPKYPNSLPRQYPWVKRGERWDGRLAFFSGAAGVFLAGAAPGVRGECDRGSRGVGGSGGLGTALDEAGGSGRGAVGERPPQTERKELAELGRRVPRLKLEREVPPVAAA